MEPDQIDMMSEEELRSELRKVTCGCLCNNETVINMEKLFMTAVVRAFQFGSPEMSKVLEEYRWAKDNKEKVLEG